MSRVFRIRALRWARGEPLSAVAERVGVTADRLAQIEKGGRPSTGLAARLEAEYGEPLAQLLAPMEPPADPVARAVIAGLARLVAGGAARELAVDVDDAEDEHTHSA